MIQLSTVSRFGIANEADNVGSLTALTVDPPSETELNREVLMLLSRFNEEPIPHEFFSWDYNAVRKYLLEGTRCEDEQCEDMHQWSATQIIAFLREAMIQARLAPDTLDSADRKTFIELCDLEIERLRPEAEREAADIQRREQRLADGLKAFRSDVRGSFLRENAEILGYKPVSKIAVGSPEKVVKQEEPEADVPEKFTRKQVIYLLQELIPEFKDADNTKKAQFITKLTPYNYAKGIADEFSNIRNFSDPELLDRIRQELRASGRGRKKK